jgi:FkbM family methyltransferase
MGASTSTPTGPRPSVLQLARFIWTHPANRGRRIASLARACRWQVRKRTTGRAMDVDLARLRLRCYPDSTSASLALYCSGRPDYHEMGFLEHYLRPGDGFIDVGANVGLYTLLAAARVGAEGTVEAFEPGDPARARLLENLARNGIADRVRVHDAAAGAEAGTVRFLPGRDTTGRILTPDESHAAVEVDCVRLDDALPGRSFALGKMDIEGAEPLALAGAERRLAAGDPPVWILELNGCLRDFGSTEQGFADWLAERGYDLALYDADRRTLTFSEQPWRERGNVLAVARNAHDWLAARVPGLELRTGPRPALPSPTGAHA